jgi:type IX secretion system PorP/SprF family membrane protein
MKNTTMNKRTLHKLFAGISIVQQTLEMHTKTIYLSLLGICMHFALQAQDFHYSQFYNAPLNLNPALTGIFRGDARVAGIYRSQWSSVPVDYMTFSLSADKQFVRRTAKTGFFSGGLAFNYDRAGYSKLYLINVGLSGSYTKRFTQTFFGTVGAQVGVGQRAFKTGDLTFDRQFDDTRGTYDPNLSNGEDFSNTSNMYVDFSAGLNLRLQSLRDDALVDRLEKRSKLDVGLGFFHLNRPDQSFLEGDKAPLSMRLSPYLLGVVQLGKSDFDLVANATAQFQNPYREYLGMLGIRYHLSRDLGNQVALQLGGAYRFNDDFGDAFVPGIELSYNAWEAAFTYDINVSDFNVATRQRGGPEVSVRWYLRKVRALPYRYICPLI